MMSPELRKGLRTWIEVDTRAISQNYKTLRSILSPRTKLMAVVKSNAYGHGLIDFSKEMAKLGADFLGVDSIVEALALRKEGIKLPILVLGYTLPEMIEPAIENDISITVSNFDVFKSLPDKKIKVHIKVDTGMCRQGFSQEQILEVLSTLKKMPNVVVEGLYTHFGAAKNPSFPQRTLKQIDEFNLWIEAFKKESIAPIIHAAASGGALIFPQAHFDMVRIGISIYGLWPAKEVKAFSQNKHSFVPALFWKTIVAEVKKVKAGCKVGYDFTEEIKLDSILAVCPIGYWHGFSRNLSSIGEVIVGDKKARVIGRVSMDMIVVDISDISGIKVGDEVTIIGNSKGNSVSADDMAYLSDTSSYEIVTRINPLIKRIYL